MYDEIPAPPTTDVSSDDRSGEQSANPEPAPTRSDREPDRVGADRDGPDRSESDRPRDGVDPPAEVARDRSESDRSERDRSESDGDDDECGPESAEYRLERLRLWRTVVTLAVVVARLIRSL
ncbi:hypothetical protein [Halorubrum sp. CSM-61]|uniref:hypothetical protein n=1 Tax=Halorubrum sp. CSM-61 TaxID=2485838 RepID=UPI000F4B7820|nr:hypothetical protein [Halorubrum sp. CSM-61]